MTENAAKAATPASPDKLETVEIRRMPKFLPFLLTGGVAGLIVALILWVSSGSNQNVFGYLIAYGTGLGAAAGIIAATVAEASTRKRAKRATATKLEG